MHVALPILLLVAAVVLVSAVARRVSLSAPLLLTGIGAVASFIPGMPVVEVEAEVVLLGFLPPLLFAAASQTSLVDLRRDRLQILRLSVGLVLFTTFGVALVAWWLLPIEFAAAVALGAVVAPPDAVAATAVARRIGLPRRIVSILEGESLFNDATALVTLRTALAATGGAVTVWGAGLDFLTAAVGGGLIGVLAFLLIATVRRRLTDTTASVILSFMSPWVAYLPAESVHASGVIAAVVCGVLLAHKAPYLQTAQSRVAERLNWASVQFLLENLVFLLIGLQAAAIYDHVAEGELGMGRVFVVSLAVLATVIALRVIWLVGFAVLARGRGPVSSGLTGRESAVAGWAGMRGVVTLAAAFTITTDQVPQRDVLVFIALVVTIGTLVLQGFSLGWVANKCGLHAPDPREDALQQAQLLQAALGSGVKRLEEEVAASDQPVDERVMLSLATTAERRANLAWERLGRSSEGSESATAAYRRLRLAMIDAERAKVLKFRDKGVMDHEVHAEVMQAIDVEESMISAIDTRDAEARERLLLTPEKRQGGCEELRESPTAVDPSTHEDVCVACLEEGTEPVQLRMCLTCGNVACCDSSVARHATRHYDETGHPVMRSFEPGEAWRWCYAHHLLG